MRKTSTILFFVGLLMLVFIPLNAGIIHVEEWGNDGSADGSPGNPFGTIQGALGATPIGDTILVGDGYYFGPLSITKDVSVMSLNGPEFCTIEGNGFSPTVSIDSCSALFGGFNVINGYEQILLGDSIIHPIIEHCYIDGYGTYKGITVYGDSGIIHHNVIVNTLDWGISVNSGHMDIINNTLYQTMTGIYLGIGDSSKVINNIITNSVTGISLDSANFFGIVVYNDIWNNGTNVSDPVYILDPTNMSIDPLFIDTTMYDFGLQPGSPCIDAGNPAILDKDSTRSDIGAIIFFQGEMAMFDFYIPSNCEPAYVEFYNNSSFPSQNGKERYEWEINSIFAYNGFQFDTTLMSGYYNVRLIAYDSNDVQIGEFFRSFDIYYCGGSDVLFSIAQFGSCPGDTVKFYNSSYFSGYSGEVTYIWNINGFSYTGFELPDTTLPGGNYNVNLEAYDTLGGYLGSYGSDFYVEGSLGYFRISSGGEACPNEPINFWYEGSSYNLYWDMGNGTTFYNNYFDYVYPIQGTYEITLIVNDYCGTDTIKQSITVSDSAIPEVDAFTEKGNVFCPYDEILFRIQGKYPLVEWHFEDGAILNGLDVRYAFPDTGMHQVIAQATNSCGNTGYDTLYIEIRTNIEVYSNFDWWFEGPPCPFTPAKFNPHSAGNYLWNFGDGVTSTDPSPKHAYTNEGMYNVKLVTYNGCGFSDTMVNYLSIYYSYGQFYLDFNIRTSDDDDNGDYGYDDTLRICPGEEIYLEPWDDYSGIELKYFWDFGDGDTSLLKKPVHSYTTAGLKTITLRAKNNCRDTSFSVRYVYVDPTIRPISNLMHIPSVVCPGDKVFFFDMDSKEPEENKYTYSIDFGDGTAPVTDITIPEDPKINTLASHAYSTEGEYEYIFTVTNLCNNTDTVINTVYVNDSAGIIPFYYVRNSTQPHEEDNFGEIEDWSIDKGGYSHKFIIPVQWSNWMGGMENTFYVYFWYGGFNPDDKENGNPDGMVSFTSDIIVAGDSVVAYVPVKITEFHSIGMAAAWYCDSAFAGDEPEVFGMPVDGLGNPINSFPLFNGNTTDLRPIGPGNIMLDPGYEWDGICRSNKPRGRWKSPIGNGQAYFLGLDDNDGQNNYYLELGPEFPNQYGYTTDQFISSGNYYISNDTILLYPDGGDNCMGMGIFTFDYLKDSLLFYIVLDTCDQRQSALTNGWFYKAEDESFFYNRMYEGCPGDPVEFTVVGGNSYEWHFGDGNTATSSNTYEYHTYVDTGFYDAFVIVTNSCSRVDTVASPVTITDKNIPMAYFDVKPWDTWIGDTVYFKYQGYDPTGSFVYTWYFGDGSSPVNGPFAKHVYFNGGEYPVKLVVSNGCGQNEQIYFVFVKGGLENCETEARFITEIINDSVQFINNSYGDITDIYWDFGDGNYSNDLNPLHIYSEPGIYTVCLSVIDSSSQCQDGICLDVQVGNIDCFADFIFSKVNATNTLILTDKSLGATSRSWNFGDGTTSILKDPVHTYTSPGLYNVCLNIANADQTCFADKCIPIQIGIIDSTECFPEFAYFVDSLTVSFTDQSTGNITNWYWNFGDGATSVNRSKIHTYAKSGIYKVCLSVFDTVSECQKQVCKFVKVGDIECMAKYSYFVDSTMKVKFTDKSIGAVSEWLWDFNDGNFSILQNPVYQYSKPGVYDVCLTTYDSGTDCFSESCQRITVGQVQDCFAEYEYFVDNLTVKFSDKSLGTVTTRYWDFGNGTFGFSANPTVTYKKPGIKHVCYFVFDTISGCQSEVCKDIEVGDISCKAEFSYFIDQETKKVDLFDNSIGVVNKWLWEFGNGTISFDTNASVTYTNYGVYNVCLTVSENVADGCVSSVCKDITVKDTNTIVCDAKYTYVVSEGTRSVTFKDATLTPVTSWFWDLGDGEFSKDSVIKHTYSQDGIYNVCLSTYNAPTGCYSEKCKDVTIKTTNDTIETLDAEFTYIPKEGTSEVTFIDQSTGNITNWYWTFGDGSYSKGEQEITHIYGKAGNYMVCLYIYDAATGNTSEECKLVPVGTYDCSLTASFGKFIDPDTRIVNFSDKTTGSPAKWFWSFGDGTTSTVQNPKHQYEKAGFYLVSLSVKDNNSCTDYVADFIQVGSVDCKALFTYTIDADSNKVTLTSTSKGDLEKYFWSFDDGTFGKGSSISHKYKKPGLYMISLMISSSGGTCTDYVVEPVQVGTVDCSADFTAYVDSASNTAYFSNEVIGNSTRLLWQFGDGGISIAENPVHKYKAPGYFTVGLNTYDPGLNCMDYTEQLILIGQRGIDCEADFYYQVDGRDVDFYDKSIGDNLSYFWWFGDGATRCYQADTSITYAEGGYYFVCLTVYTPSGIQNTRCKHIAVDPPDRDDCLAQFIYTVDSASQKVTFIDQSLGEPNKWLWKFGDGSSSNEQNPEHTYTQPDFYKVRLVSGDTTTGCKSRAWEMVNVGMEGVGLIAGFGYEIDSLSLKTGGYPVDFVGVSSGKPARYVWDFGDGDMDSTNTSPNHNYSEPGEYTVCLTVEDQVTSESDEDCQLIIIEDTTTTGIERKIISPAEFVELTNYPNPFDNYTTISYSLPSKTRIDLTVYDETGRLVTTLVSTIKEAGTHKLTWDAINIPKGLYYIQLKTSQGIVKTRMVVKH